MTVGVGRKQSRERACEDKVRGGAVIHAGLAEKVTLEQRIAFSG